jgi:hypothetical protein
MMHPEQRHQADRRKQPTTIGDALFHPGRRMHNRRAADCEAGYFVDRFSSLFFVLILLLIFASLADAVLTLHLIGHGSDELNPLMRHMLSHGVATFIIGKYVMTVVGLPLLLIFGNFRLFGSRFRIKYLIPVFLALYTVLLGYQLCLESRAGWQCPAASGQGTGVGQHELSLRDDP